MSKWSWLASEGQVGIVILAAKRNHCCCRCRPTMVYSSGNESLLRSAEVFDLAKNDEKIGIYYNNLQYITCWTACNIFTSCCMYNNKNWQNVVEPSSPGWFHKSLTFARFVNTWYFYGENIIHILGIHHVRLRTQSLEHHTHRITFGSMYGIYIYICMLTKLGYIDDKWLTKLGILMING